MKIKVKHCDRCKGKGFLHQIERNPCPDCKSTGHIVEIEEKK